MSTLTFHERMAGSVALGVEDYNQGLAQGEPCAVDLHITVADVDAFLADPAHAAAVAGTVELGALGGTLAIVSGVFNLFVGDGSRKTMEYRLLVRDLEERPFTLSGFKDVADDAGLDVWSDTTTLFTTLTTGHGDGGELLGRGILRISHAGFAKQMLSMRVRGGAPWTRAAALARFQLAFAGTLAHVYGGRARRGGRPDFPDAVHPDGDPFRGHEPGAWHDLPGQAGLQRRILPLRAGDGLQLTLHNVRASEAGGGPPVLCLHGVGVRGDLFVGAPGGSSTARALVDAGFDVWIANWRASMDFPPRPFTLDDAAVFDHPAAIAAVLRETGASSLRVLAHCQGATSFTMTALAGLAPEVTHVLASAVSLHTVVPWRTRVKSRLLLPLIGLRMPYVSAQWAIRSPTALGTAIARQARLIRRRDCDSPVCHLGNYMYGTGRDVLWVHERLGPDAHEWIAGEFGFAPYRFLKQMGRCTARGHLVPATELPALPADFTTAAIPAGQRWTFLAGTRNRLYLPAGQERSHAHWKEGGAADATLHLLEGYGHLDPLLGPGAPDDVFPLVVGAFA